mmetsp:Transcript_37042/g.68379  ORF Transcript_37042/g.68379 Transcript_37042/m.68379 type:complete len:94 (+) Transcript_37042:106-387(+)
MGGVPRASKKPGRMDVKMKPSDSSEPRPSIERNSKLQRTEMYKDIIKSVKLRMGQLGEERKALNVAWATLRADKEEKEALKNATGPWSQVSST